MRMIVVALALLISACTTGGTIMTGEARDPVPAESVRVYAAMPAGAVQIGIVQAHTSEAVTGESASDASLAELKRRAAAIGANGVVLTKVATGGSALNYTNAMGAEAIYVP